MKFTCQTTAILLPFAFCLMTLQPAVSQDETKKDEPKKKAAQPTRKISSFAELCIAYETQKIKFKRNDKNESILFQTSKGVFSGVMVVKWERANGVCHFIQTMPLELKAEQVDLFLRAAQTLNHGFLFPGLGVNLNNMGTYYRLSIPVAPRGYLLDFEVGTYTKFALNKISEFMPSLKDTLDKKIKIEELILSHQKHIRALRAKLSKKISLSGKFTRDTLGSHWELDFSKPGVVQVSRDDKVGVVSTIKIEGDQITFTDQKGPLAAKEPGVYKIFLSNDKLSFRVSEDPVEARTVLLGGGTWNLEKWKRVW